MSDSQRRSPAGRAAARAVMLVLAPLLLAGCAAFRSDLDGIKACRLPEEYRVAPVNGLRPIDPSLLGQAPPPEYRMDAGDVLAVYVEGVLGNETELPPLQAATLDYARPTTGFPVTVRDDGTLSLPYAEPIHVRGLTLRGVEQRLRDYYTREKPLLQGENARILVSLHRPRTYRVLVVRQESGNRQGNIGSGGTVNFEIDKRGTGRIVELPAYQNDVLHALSATGGLPGVDARNVVYVVRRPRCDVAVPPVHVSPPVEPAGMLPPARVDPQLAPAPVEHPGSDRQPTMIWSPLSQHSRPVARRGPVVRAQSPAPATVNVIETPDWNVGPRPRSGAWTTVPPRWNTDTPSRTWAIEPPPLHVDAGPHPANRDLGTPPPSWGAGTYPRARAIGTPPPPEDTGFAHVPDRGPRYLDVEFRLDDATIDSNRVMEIPLRIEPGRLAPFGPEDVVLHDGDVVFIESRQTEFFYTAGLLGGGQYPIPRDFDLNVIEALALVDRLGSGRNRLDRQVSGPAATGLDVSASASRLIILRTLPDGHEVNIEVDLYKAMEDPSERILIAPGDYLFLKYTRSEAIGAWIERWLFDNVANGVNNSRIVTGNQN